MRSLLLLSAATLAIIAGTFAIGDSQAESAQARPARPVWEYKVVHLKDLVGESRAVDDLVQAMQKNLNDVGDEGWEMCQEINGAVIFKREP